MAEAAERPNVFPAILRNPNTNIDVDKCIENLCIHLRRQEFITAQQQYLLKNANVKLVDKVNDFITQTPGRRPIELPSLSDSSFDSGDADADSSPENEAVALSTSTIGEEQPVLPLRAGTKPFLKYIEQLREDLMSVFIPEPGIEGQNFRSHRSLKKAFGVILYDAQIWRTRDLNEIIVFEDP